MAPVWQGWWLAASNPSSLRGGDPGFFRTDALGHRGAVRTRVHGDDGDWLFPACDEKRAVGTFDDTGSVLGGNQQLGVLQQIQGYP